MTATTALLLKGAAILGTVLIAGGLAFALTGDGATEAHAGPARAWVDDPLDGEVVPPGPVSVVAHAYDPGGVSEMVLVVDGIELEVVTPADAGAVLGSVTWSWVPDGEGIHVIEVVARDADGLAGIPGRAVIEVRRIVAAPDPPPLPTTTTTLPATTTTTTSTTTTTAAPTTTTTLPATTTTAPPCTPSSALLLSPADGQNFAGPTPEITFDWAYLFIFVQPTCPPSGYYVEVATTDEFTDDDIVVSSDFEASTTEWTPEPTTWSCDTTYHWRVWSKDAHGAHVAVSVVWEFVVFCVK